MSKFEVASTSIEIFAASCSGCRQLSISIGLPVACVRVSNNIDATLDCMNAVSHGGWALWPGSFQPFEPQEGWGDWRLVPLSGDVLPDKVRCGNDRYRLDLPSNVTPAEFEASLHTELRRFRLDEVASSPSWAIARSEAQQSVLTLPRYTVSDPENLRTGVARVDDLFVLEPSCHRGFIALMARRAKARANRIAEEASRDE